MKQLKNFVTKIRPLYLSRSSTCQAKKFDKRGGDSSFDRKKYFYQKVKFFFHQAFLSTPSYTHLLLTIFWTQTKLMDIDGPWLSFHMHGTKSPCTNCCLFHLNRAYLSNLLDRDWLSILNITNRYHHYLTISSFPYAQFIFSRWHYTKRPG